MDYIAPAAIEAFRKKAEDHSGAPHFMLLGAKGQFAEINKKFWKLYNAIWQDRDLRGEQPYEIVQDLIGHCLLMLWCLEDDKPVQGRMFKGMWIPGDASDMT
ncbi:MAG TPA: hypothetical protein VH593_25225 [Ktedonobacteraceae bacterium]|jgi:hypothetical protein